ncbi:MAG TPA: type I restriction endonuclease [Terriglobia bacterium]|nr:type I restriction endonuclease [Terriglobia bacterium]
MTTELPNLQTESDVEQKRFFAFTTTPEPRGLGYKQPSVRTKPNVRGFQIDKGKSAHIYYPDYVLLSQGLPVVVAEVKKPGASLEEAYREARLYAAELNAQYPAGINPVRYVVVANDNEVKCGFWDQESPDLSSEFPDELALNAALKRIADKISSSANEQWAESIQKRLASREYWKPTGLLGGQSVRNEEIAPNSFGTTLALEYKHLFNPTTFAERSFIVRNAYITSARRERYVDPIDKIIRAAAPPSEVRAVLIQNTEVPKEIIDRLRETQRLANQVILLIGGVGSGKSTFVDYLREVKLPADLKGSTIWLGLDMNFAPVDRTKVYDWVMERLCEEIRKHYPEVDFELLATLEKLYGPELRQLKKGPLQLLPAESTEYKTRLTDFLLALQRDPQKTTNAMLRHCASERGLLPIIVFDNCDKRQRDEQLLMFEVAQWLRSEFRVLVILPLRDETYDNHRSEPPLDTAIKDLVFRIEPPLFSRVLTERIKLTLREMQRTTGKTSHAYVLPNGMRVEYPDTELGYYLSCIIKSVFEYDRFVRRLIMGLAGRNLRKAMEIFLEFCTSGHIDSGEVFKIRQNQGNYTLPYPVVARVLLYGNRRFYSSEHSYIKNVFSCEKRDTLPNYFVRVAILEWLNERFKVAGPNRLKGYHSVASLKGDLIPLGFGEEHVQRELQVLVLAGCVVAEHLRADIGDEDLVRLAPSGSVHRTLASNVEYLGAIAEDEWFSAQQVAQSISARIADRAGHYQRHTTLLNASALLAYLRDNIASRVLTPEKFLAGRIFDPAELIQDTLSRASSAVDREIGSDAWLGAAQKYPRGCHTKGTVVKAVNGGVLVELEPNIVGFLEIWGRGDRLVNQNLEVTVKWIDPGRKRMGLARKRKFPGW